MNPDDAKISSQIRVRRVTVVVLWAACLLVLVGFALRPRYPRNIPWITKIYGPSFYYDGAPMPPDQLLPTVRAWAEPYAFEVRAIGKDRIEVYDNWGDPFLTVGEGLTYADMGMKGVGDDRRLSSVALFPERSLQERVADKLASLKQHFFL